MLLTVVDKTNKSVGMNEYRVKITVSGAIYILKRLAVEFNIFHWGSVKVG